MKTLFKKITLIVTAAAAVAMTQLTAQADIYSYSGRAFTNTAAGSSTNGAFYNNTSTNLTALTATAASVVVNSDPINVGAHRGFSLWQQLVSNTNSATGNVTNRYDYSMVTPAGATIWTTTHPLLLTSALNGTNPVVNALVVDKTTVDNVNSIRLYDIWVAAQAGITNTVTVSQPLLNATQFSP